MTSDNPRFYKWSQCWRSQHLTSVCCAVFITHCWIASSSLKSDLSSITDHITNHLKAWVCKCQNCSLTNSMAFWLIRVSNKSRSYSKKRGGGINSIFYIGSCMHRHLEEGFGKVLQILPSGCKNSHTKYTHHLPVPSQISIPLWDQLIPKALVIYIRARCRWGGFLKFLRNTSELKIKSHQRNHHLSHKHPTYNNDERARQPQWNLPV